MKNGRQVEFLTKFIIESDAIENITDNLETVRDELLNGKADGHVGAMLYLISLAQKSATHYLDHADIQLVQRLITSEQHPKPGGERLPKRYRGFYRDCGVIVGGRRCMHQREIPAAMDKLLKKTRLWQEHAGTTEAEKNVEQIADFHYDFLVIHPFADGNGRTGRALAYFLFLCASLKPFIFTAADKYSAYYPCFDRKTPELMRKYFLDRYAPSNNNPAGSTAKTG